MSDAYQHLMFELDMDISSFKSSVSQVETAIKNVAAARKLAIGDEFVKLSGILSELKGSLSNLNQVGLAPKEVLKTVGDTAKQSRIALTSLSQVAQDLPFGFIGIQNNLPILLQSFQQLRETSTSNSAALKSLGQSLIGPSGVMFAFSVIISGITFLIQKYGSLGNAIDVLFSKNSELVKSQLEYNKAISEGNSKTIGEVSQIKILSETLTNSQNSQKIRLEAYTELKKIRPDILAGISKENSLTGDGARLILERSNATIEYIKLKVKENAIIETLNKTGEEQLKRESALGNAKRVVNSLQKELNDLYSKPLSAQRAQHEVRLKDAIERQNVVVVEARSSLFQLYDVQNSYTKLLDPAIKKISEYDTATETLTNTQKDQEKQVEKDSKKREKQYEKDLKFIESVIKYYERLEKFVPNIDISGIQKAFFEISNQINGFNISNRVKLNVEVAKSEMDSALRDIQMKAEKGGYKPANFVQTNLPGTPTEGEVDTANKFSKSVTRYKQELGEFNKMAAQNHTTMGELAKSFEDTQKKLDSAFFRPISNMFTTFLTTGKFTFKSIGDAIKKMIAEVAAKIITTGILKSLAAIMNPEGAQASKLQNPNYMGNGNSGGWLKNIGSLIAGFMGSSQMNPNFAGVTGSSTEMRGQVNMVLRGTDLVGSINRTNAVINRIG